MLEPLHPDYPLPDLDDPVTLPFWQGAQRRQLMLQRDRRTGKVHWPPKPLYWNGGELEWFVASGTGAVYSYVVGHEPFLPPFRQLLPLIMVLVEVDEGPRLVGYMINCRPDEMAFGLRVRVAFRDLTERITLPVWEPDR